MYTFLSKILSFKIANISAIITGIKEWSCIMKFITISELRAYATKIVAEVEASGEEVIVTKHGKPVVLIRRVSSG